MASVLIYAIGSLLIAAHVIVHMRNSPRILTKVSDAIKGITVSNPILIASMATFIAKYSMLLLFKGIIDWDVTSYYLPHARTIFDQDKIPLYPELPLRPIGISVLYSWVYALSSSTAAENFRLVPLPFSFAALLMVYLIAKSLFSEKVATLAVIIYVFMPLHDWILFISSFYPDIAFDTLFLGVFYFIYKYVKTGKKGYGFLCGISLGLSTLMKIQGFNLYPMMLLVLLPLFHRRSSRLVISFLTPLAFLLCAPLLLPQGLNQIVFQERLMAISLIFLLAALIFLIGEVQAKGFGSSKLASQHPVKMLLFVCVVSLPFALVWMLRNYYFFGTFISEGNINDPAHQFATAFLRSLSTTQSAQPLMNLYLVHLSSFFSFLTISYLGTVWLLPKLIGMIKSAQWNKESSFIYIWFFGHYVWYFYSLLLYPELINVINFRWLFPIAPILAVFSAVGTFLLIKSFTKTEDTNAMILLTVFLGVFSAAQFHLIYLLRPFPFDSIFTGISMLVGVPWITLTGELAWYPENLTMESLNLLKFGLLVSALSLILLELYRHPPSLRLRKVRIHVPRETHIRSVHPIRKFGLISKSDRFILLTLLILLTTQALPYALFIYQIGDGDLSTVKDKERLMFDFEGLYEEILPYLLKSVNKGDSIVAVDVRQTGLYYYLNDARFIDIENLIPYLYPNFDLNATQILSTFHSLKVRYFLLPGTYPGVTGRGKQIVEELSKKTPLLSIVRNTEYFVRINTRTTGWELYELKNKTQKYAGFTGVFLRADGYMNIMGNFTAPRSLRVSNKTDLDVEVKSDISGGTFDWSKPITYNLTAIYDVYYLPTGKNFSWAALHWFKNNTLQFVEETQSYDFRRILQLDCLEEILQKINGNFEQYLVAIRVIELTAKQGDITYSSKLSAISSGHFTAAYVVNDGWWVYKGSHGLAVE